MGAEGEAPPRVVQRIVLEGLDEHGQLVRFTVTPPQGLVFSDTEITSLRHATADGEAAPYGVVRLTAPFGPPRTRK